MCFQISAFFAGNLSFFEQTLGDDESQSEMSHKRQQRLHPMVNIYRQRAADYIDQISRVGLKIVSIQSCSPPAKCCCID